MKKLIWISVFTIIIAASYFLFLNDDTGTSEMANPLERTEKVTRSDLVVTVSAVGTVEPKQAVDVKSKASGQIMRIEVDEGDFVKKNDLICTLDKTTAINEFRQAEADLKVARVTLQQAEKELKRQLKLFNNNLISEAEYDAALLEKELAQSKLIRAEAALGSAEEKLDDTVVKSPIDGVILKRYVDDGQIISSGISNVGGGTSIVMVAIMDTVYVEVDVDETDIGKVEIGQSCKIKADAYPDKEFYGNVIKISPIGEVEQNVTYFTITTTVENSERLLKAGMNATCEITAAEAYDVLVVPRAAVTEKSLKEGSRGRNTDEGYIVFVEKNGEFVPTPVETGISSYEFAEIKSGLSEGDEILVRAKSMVMANREEFRERMRRWNQLPGVKKSE